MAKAIPFPSLKPEQEVIYFELIPEGNPHPRIYLKHLNDPEMIETELTVLTLNE